MRRIALRSKKEICLTAEKYPGARVSTVFLGGGTPSLVPAAQMRGVLEELRRRFDVLPDADITAEGNPRHPVPPGWLEAACAVRTEPPVAGDAGRAGEVAQSHWTHPYLCPDGGGGWAMARAAGIRNLNVDLMSGLPGQTLRDWP